jgi:hypothetical protein
MQEWFNICKLLNEISYINRRNVKNCMIISIDAKKALNKISLSFMIKAMMKLELEGLHLKMIKTIYEKPLANIILNGET